MGTNYYFHEQPCANCGHETAKYHIGKSSGGWCFALHVAPEMEIRSLWDWVDMIQRVPGEIRDEDGEKYTLAAMLEIICGREWSAGWDRLSRPTSEIWSYTSEEDFHRRNHSERGPNNLLRHKIEDRHCIGHGEGTWDYIVGDFS